MMLGLGLGLPIAGGSFQPTQIGGCVLWLRADLGITLNGSTVSAWADQSGQANDVTQATGTAQPTYTASDVNYGGHPTLSFAGASSQSLARATTPALAQPFTFLAVGQETGGTAGCFVCGGNSNNVQLYEVSGDAHLYAGADLVSSTSVSGPSAMAGVVNGASSTLYVNTSGSPVASGATGSNTVAGAQIGIGASSSNPLTGKIAEAVVYSGALSAAQIAQLFRYFAARYGGAWS